MEETDEVGGKREKRSEEVEGEERRRRRRSRSTPVVLKEHQGQVFVVEQCTIGSLILSHLERQLCRYQFW